MRRISRRFTLSLVAAMFAISTVGMPATSAVARPAPAAAPVRGVAHPVAPVAPSAAQLTTAETDVAARHKLSVAELKKRMKNDRRLKIGRGRLLFTEPTPEAIDPTALAAGSGTAVGALAVAVAPTPSQAFTLHSLPGSKRVIFLDFDGHSLAGTAWASSFSGTAPAFDTDGNPGSFSDAERNVIIGTWQRVAEDYAAFDVDVTTQYPGESSITRSGGTDEYFGMRVLISPISSYFGGGGIAYVGVFGATGDYYKPALVFNNALANSAKYIGEACSHEVGHTLGLYHDGLTTGGAYYSGHGSGETGWAPIMGCGYYRNLSQWSKGEYPNANNKEDDLVVVQSNGLTVRPDDFGNSNAAAYVVPSGTTFGVSGLLERNTDMDYFKLSVGSGVLTVNLAPATVGPDVDVLAELRNSAGTLMATANPADLLGGSMSTNVSAGTYYLSVKGTGKADLTTGYSAYASVGSYAISGTMSPGTVTQVPPTATAKATPSSGVAPLATQFDSTLSSDPDGTIVSWYWSFGDGTTSTSANPAHTYANAGTYSAWLTVTDNSGLTATSNVVISVAAANVAPRAVISANPLSGVAPLATTFSGSGSSDADGSVASYTWDFGDGQSASGVSASHTYATAGNYTAKLTVVDNRGASASTTVAIAVTSPVTPGGLVAAISAGTPTGYAPLTTTFSAAGTTVSGATILSYRWDFGDGLTAQGKTTSHAYKNVGTYNVTVTVRDSLNRTDSKSMAIVVTQDPAKIVHVQSIQFTTTTYTDSYGVSARVNVVGPDGRPVQGVLVTGTWSGAVSKTVKVTSNSTGNANFTSGRFTGGTLTFTVDSLTKVSYGYDPGANTVTFTSVALAQK